MRNVKYIFPDTNTESGKNADGTEHLSKDEQRQLREQESARRTAELREGIKRRHRVLTAARLATNNAIADGSAGEKLQALLTIASETAKRRRIAM